MHTLTALWLMDVMLSSMVIFFTVRYLNIVNPRGRRMAYKFANPMVKLLDRLGKYYTPLAFMAVGLLANVMAISGNLMACIVTFLCGIVAIHATRRTYVGLVGLA